MRIKVTLSYDGSEFNGFQIQSSEHKVTTVAGALTKALKRLNINSTLVGSGRTDTGVHATAQTLHCETPSFWSDTKKLKDELNRISPPSIYIKDVECVDDQFHARFSAKKRLYRYVLYSGKYQPFLAKYALHVKSINTEKLNKILKHFIGIHDFTSFKKQGSDTNSSIREVFKAGAYTHKGMTIIYFQGSSFVRSQIRMMCSFAIEVMRDSLTSEQLNEQLKNQNRYSTAVIGSSGLYLARIYY